MSLDASAAAAGLNARGVVCVRDACGSGPGARSLCADALAETQRALKEFLALPAPMSASGPVERHFLRYTTGMTPANASALPCCTHRRDFVVPLHGSRVEALLRAVLGTGQGGGVGDTLADAGVLGNGKDGGANAELQELTVIVSEPGARAQPVHSDNTHSAAAADPRLVTVFIPLHDIPDHSLGPTRFWPETHAPACFRDGKWIPPDATAELGLEDTLDGGEKRRVPVRDGAEKSVERKRKSTSFLPLRAGDAVLMDPLTWHCGGANATEAQQRTLVSMSWRADGGSGSGGDCLRLGDFLGAT